MFWLGFSVFPGIGPTRFNQLLLRFQTAQEAWSAPLADVTSTIGPAIAHKFDEFRKSFSLTNYRERLKKANVSFLISNEDEYPALLKEIKNPPFVLFYKGNKDLLCHPGKSETTDRTSSTWDSIAPLQNDNKYVGIVGTRKITSYGKQVTEKITDELVAANCVIVSGLAMGVDAVAHITTINNQGRTIAVLGCGVDCCSPATNQAIYNSILEHEGVIVSEYPLNEPPSIGSFPSRNRIIAGLSHGIVVTEGAADSGALITAKDAIENDRKIFAVPGPITSHLSHGPNELIKAGAIMVTSGADILTELGIKGIKSITSNIVGETKEEQKIIDVLLYESLGMDDIVRKTHLSSSQVSVILSLLEMRGIVLHQTDGAYGLV